MHEGPFCQRTCQTIQGRKRKRRVHKMCNIYLIAWTRIMKISQIDVLFTVTRTKKERQVTYAGYPAFLFRSSIFVCINGI